MRKPNWPLIRMALFTAMVVVLAMLPLALIKPAAPDWAPSPLRDYAFDMRLAIAPTILEVSSLVQAPPQSYTLYRDTFGETVQFESQGLTISGTLYQPATAGPHPGILLLHGSSPEGSQLGLYRVLGNMLAQQGYVTLAIDQRGYGQSDDPPRTDVPGAFDFVGDAKQSISYLGALASVDPQQLYVVGHSFGGDVAIASGVEDERIRKIVAIGPARRFTERGGTEDAPEFDYFRRREMRYMDLPQAVSADAFVEGRAALPIEHHVDYFATPGHKPLLLIDGALESEQDREFLKNVYDSMAEPKAYVTLANADHYANTGSFGPFVVYDQATVEALARVITTWLSQTGE